VTVGAWELDILSLIGLIVICAHLASKGIQRLGIPQVVGFILVGVLLASTFLNVEPLAPLFAALASPTTIDVIHECRAEDPLIGELERGAAIEERHTPTPPVPVDWDQAHERLWRN
jgi:hypothetical protein